MTQNTTGTKRKYTVANYSVKKLILRKFDEGLNWKETAADHNVSVKTVYYWVQHKNKDSNGVPVKEKKGGRTTPKIGLTELKFIEDLFAENPSTTLKEVKEKLYMDLNLRLSLSTLSRAIHCICFTHKNKFL